MARSNPRKNTAAASAWSSRSSSDGAEGAGLTRTTATWAFRPDPCRGSCRIWIRASCSLIPRSASAASMASSTLAALLSISSTASSAPCRPLPRTDGSPAPATLDRLLSPRALASPPPSVLSARGTRISGRSTRQLPTPLPVPSAPGSRRPVPVLLDRGPSGQHVELLGDLNEVRRRPVDHQARREVDPDEAEEDRHDPGQHLLLLALPRRRPLHLALLIVGRSDHGCQEEVEGDPCRPPVSAVLGERLDAIRERRFHRRRSRSGLPSRADQVRSEKIDPRGLAVLRDVPVEPRVGTLRRLR